MSLEQTACDDLRAFERRLIEAISCPKPSTIWKLFLLTVAVGMGIAVYLWLTDPLTPPVTVKQILSYHAFYPYIFIVAMLTAEVHRAVVAEDFVLPRSITVPINVFLYCDENGEITFDNNNND